MASKKTIPQKQASLKPDFGNRREIVYLLVADAVMVASALWAAGLQSERQVLIYAVLAAAMITAAGKKLIDRQPLPCARWPGSWLIAAGCVFLAASSFATVSPIRTFERLLCLLSAVTMFHIYATARRELNPLLHATAAIAASGFIVSIIGGNEYAYHARNGDGAWRVFSTFFNPGYLSGFLAVTIPATLGLLIWVKDRGAAIGLGFAAVLQIAVLALTATRAGILALALAMVSMALLGLVSRALGRTAWIRLGAVVLVAVVLGGVVGRPATTRAQSAGGEGHSLAFRKYTWKATAAMALAKPVTGFGPGTFDVAFPQYQIAGYTRMAHSTYLQAAAEYGIPATVLIFAGWFGLLGICKLKLLRQRVDPETAPFAIAALSAFAATLLRGVFDSDWWCLPILLAVAAFSAILVLSTQEERKSTNTPQARGITACAIAILLFGLFGAQRWMTSWIRNGNAAATEAQGEFAQALGGYRAAGQAFGWNINARVRAAQLEAVHSGQVSLAEFAALRLIEPTNVKIPRSLFQVYQSQNNPKLALQALREARTLDPKASRLMLEEANLLESMGQTDEATAVWRSMLALEKSPYGAVRAIPQMVDVTFAWAHAAIGDRLAGQGHPEEARKEWQAGVSLLRKYFESLKTMQPVLQAGGLTDEDFEKSAKELQDQLESKLARASTA